MAPKSKLTHVDSRGRVKMVDVGDKPITAREAIARGSITMSADALAQIRAGAVKNGDPLQAARLAGIMAAKRTAALIPLCHPLPIAGVDIDLTPTARGYEIEARVRTSAQTGVEMEARHAEGRRQGDGDRRHPAHEEDRREKRRLHPQGGDLRFQIGNLKSEIFNLKFHCR
jgi:cyclic pyranopterin phosphate synthase